MLKNYLVIALRNLVRRKAFSLLNIFGLAIGMACSILIFLWVQDETSYDKFNTNANSVFRITCQLGDVKAAVVPVPLTTVLKKDIPGVKAATSISPASILFAIGDKKFEENHVYYADSNFLQVFTYPFIEGNEHTALRSTD